MYVITGHKMFQFGDGLSNTQAHRNSKDCFFFSFGSDIVFMKGRRGNFTEKSLLLELGMGHRDHESQSIPAKNISYNHSRDCISWLWQSFLKMWWWCIFIVWNSQVCDIFLLKLLNLEVIHYVSLHFLILRVSSLILRARTHMPRADLFIVWQNNLFNWFNISLWLKKSSYKL